MVDEDDEDEESVKVKRAYSYPKHQHTTDISLDNQQEVRDAIRERYRTLLP